MVATDDGSAAGAATGAFTSLVDKEVFNTEISTVDQEVECVFGMCPPGAFCVCEQQAVFIQDPFFKFVGYAVLCTVRVEGAQGNNGITPATITAVG